MTTRLLRKPDPTAVTEADLVEMRLFLAMAVDLYGPVYMPLFERVEMELVTIQNRSDPLSRVRRVLEARTIEVPRAALPAPKILDG